MDLDGELRNSDDFRKHIILTGAFNKIEDIDKFYENYKHHPLRYEILKILSIKRYFLKAIL